MNWNKAEFYACYGTEKQIPPKERVEIVFSGRSNVGKSSLINKLLNRKTLARVSQMPGKTATINFYKIGEEKSNIILVDLPGYGYAKVPKTEKERWQKLIGGYFSSREIDLVFQLVDFRHPPTADDLSMMEFYAEHEIPFIIALTKADKLKKKERDERRASLEQEIPYDNVTVVEFSAKTGEGIKELQGIIKEIIAFEPNQK
ncbi:MAG: ribosome biogenesis GTP-binding protein YihA/YsxC [Oscillospiraceae bacterium]|nr:ribosome biogenesis GTP-binding protein YihA/YsxC [Oscillospiraceae bacterium]